MRLLKTYPTVMGLTRRFFSEKLVFHCRLCRQLKESLFRVESPDGVICMDCFNRKLAGEPITQYRSADIVTRGRGKKKKKRLH